MDGLELVVPGLSRDQFDGCEVRRVEHAYRVNGIRILCLEGRCHRMEPNSSRRP